MRTFSQVISAREWENQHITHHNVIEAHAPLNAYSSLIQALTKHSPHKVSLNGEWKFQLFDAPELVSEESVSNISMIHCGRRSKYQAIGRCRGLINQYTPM